MNWYVVVSNLNRMFRIGIRSANEKMLKIADNRFRMSEPARYFLYGAAKRFSTFQNSFILARFFNLAKILNIRKY